MLLQLVVVALSQAHILQELVAPTPILQQLIQLAVAEVVVKVLLLVARVVLAVV